MKKGTLQKLHPMQDFGVVTGLKTTLRVQRFSDRLVPLIPFPHKHNFYHLLVVTAGKGWHEIDFERYSLEKGRVYLMKPAQVHSWQLDQKAQGYVIEFEEELFKAHPSLAGKVQTLFQVLPDSFKVDNPTDLKEVLHLCENMLQDFQSTAPDSETLASLELFTFLFRLSRLKNLKLQKPQEINSFATRFANLIEENYQQHHEVEFYAEKIHITAKALTMKMTRLTGRSARQFIQERLVLEARRLLAYSDLSVSEIAERLGFEDSNYFTRFFKLKTKYTPGEFRKKAKELL